jgi:hypothetical protein
MGVIDPANLKMYQCATWAEGASHGGAISATEIAATGDQVIFDDVTDAQRVSGVTEYRKVFIKNLNADTTPLKICINANYSAANETISIALEQSGSDVQSAATAYTYTTPSTVATGLDLGSLAQNASKGVWIKRVVSAGGNGYQVDTMILQIGTY